MLTSSDQDDLAGKIADRRIGVVSGDLHLELSERLRMQSLDLCL